MQNLFRRRFFSSMGAGGRKAMTALRQRPRSGIHEDIRRKK
ncbi:MAG: hypothetical protein ACLR8Y_00355 [Alistipes indistinctus]